MDSVLVTLEEVTVCFSVEEWALLEEWQRELHREVTAATEQLLASLGRWNLWGLLDMGKILGGSGF
uniref:KRAB domain-containing protein n=1 Tax=Phasianus colchicus TaxID=9054 RepID=A0A669QCK7_PHACC